MGTHHDLIAYKKAFSLAMDIFKASKSFPREEIYSLTDQIRRSSRSVCANLAESYAKRLYPKHFLSKLSDCDMENTETRTWLEFAKACKYLDDDIYNGLIRRNEEVGKILGYMIRNSNKFS